MRATGVGVRGRRERARRASPLVVVALLVSTLGVLAGDRGVTASAPSPNGTDPLAQPSPAPDGRADSPFVVTSPDAPGRRLLEVAATDQSATLSLTVDPTRPQQTWWGTGAALTDASVELLADNPEALDLLFDPDHPAGARLDALRLPLSSTDFSTTPWAWGWNDGTAFPTPQAVAAIDTITEQVLPRQPDLKVVAAAWSAPADLKTSSTLRGGALSRGSVTSYGALLVEQATQLRARGVPLRAVTLGNEPFHTSDYTTMTMSIAQMAALGRQVGSSLPAEVDLWAGDHNWEDRWAYDRIVDAAAGAFDGSAYHCYGGSPTQMDGPTPFRIVTECTGTTDDWASSFAWQLRNLVDVPAEHGSSGLLMWNLALDPADGPTDSRARGGCATCRGLVTIDGRQVTPGPEFYLLAHLARAAQPGARVVPVRSSAPEAAAAAFVNPDGSTGLVGLNPTESAQVVGVTVGSRTVRYAVGPGELFTYRAP